MHENFYATVIEKLRSKNKNVFCGLDTDCNFLQHGVSSIPDLIKPNIAELERLVSQKIRSLDQLKKAGEKLIRYGIQFVLVTMGDKGAAGFSKQSHLYAKCPLIKNPGSVGCGDVFLAGFVMTMSETGNFKKSLKFATAAATAKATKFFTDIPKPSEVKKMLKKILVKNFDEMDGKIEISNLQELPE